MRRHQLRTSIRQATDPEFLAFLNYARTNPVSQAYIDTTFADCCISEVRLVLRWTLTVCQLLSLQTDQLHAQHPYKLRSTVTVQEEEDALNMLDADTTVLASHIDMVSIYNQQALESSFAASDTCQKPLIAKVARRVRLPRLLLCACTCAHVHYPMKTCNPPTDSLAVYHTGPDRGGVRLAGRLAGR